MTTPAGSTWRLDAAVFLSGAALMGLEIVGSRILAPVFGNSLFVWGALITTFLAALALGYALGGRFADRRPDPETLAALLAGSGVLLFVIFASPEGLLAALGRVPVPERFRALVASALLFGPPSVVMGMVTPFAVRLAARDIRTVGSAAGRFSALSTAGSILGTFATAFFLIPTFPTRPILFSLGSSLLVASLLVPARRLARRVAVVVVAAAAGAAVYTVAPVVVRPPLPVGTLVYEKETAYHRLRVVDQGLRRALFFDRSTQGFVPVRPGVETDQYYTDGLVLGLALAEDPRSVVAIGLGAGMAQTVLSARAPEIATTSIEIDPEVVDVARRFFGFAPDGNDRVIVGDGRRELDAQVAATDVVLLDAYFSESIPFHLVTEEFDALCKRKMTPRGALAVNFAGLLTGKGNALFWASVKTLQKVFPCVYIFSSELASGQPTFKGNAIVVATRSPDRFDRETVASRGRALATRLKRPGVEAWSTYLYEGEIRTGDVPILTDAYSPTDALQQFSR
ncbi:MAG TPA: fused MFS/spermidine synthase [Thermoanaerobaculia bacterium]